MVGEKGVCAKGIGMNGRLTLLGLLGQLRLMFELSDPLREYFGGSFDAVMGVEGEVHRAKEGRRTVSFVHEGQEYFAKVHGGVGWGEVVKNLCYLKSPAVDASNEWEAAAHLERVGVRTVEIVGKGLRGWNPARRESFVVMKGLEEGAVANEVLREHPPAALKRLIWRKVARSVRRMHDSGMNHRDCYLCHFHLPERDWSQWAGVDDFEVPMIDLHRAQIRGVVPRRWLVKDLGALLFSALECGPTDRDLLLLWKTYLGPGWRAAVGKDESFWRRVWERALKFYRRDHGVEPVVPGIFAKLVR